MRLLLSFLAIVLFVAAAAPVHAAGEKESVYDRVMRTGTIRCSYALWPPTVFYKDAHSGAIKGIFPEIMETMAENLHLKVEWAEEVGWGQVVETLRSGRTDVFCSALWQVAELGRYIDFNTPLFYSTAYLYVRPDDHRFDDDFSKINTPDVKMAIMDGENSDAIQRMQFPQSTPVAIPQLAEITQMLMNVQTGKADVVFTEPGLVKDFLKTNPDSLRKVGDQPFQVYPNSFGVLLGETKLRIMMDSALTEMLNQGIVQKIVDKYEPDKNVFIPVAKPYQMPEE